MESYYALQGHVRYYGRLPEATEISGGHVLGTLGLERANPAHWKEPPHERLANLPTCDAQTGQFTTEPVSGLAEAKAVEAFVKKHGVLGSHVDEATGGFDEDVVHFADAQDTLRRAWMGDTEAVKEIEEQVEDALETRISVQAKGIEVTTENLWSFICVLFLRDRAAGKTKFCANPDCPNPYFLRKRKGQEFCSHPCAVLINVRRFRERLRKQKKSAKRR